MFQNYSIAFLLVVGLFWVEKTPLAKANNLKEKYRDAPEDAVTCGSAIKLTHVESSAASRKNEVFFLNSETKALGGGSGQQLVSVVGNDPSSTNFLWLVRGPNDPSTKNGACQDGTAYPVKCDDVIRLTHVNTQRNLHSHEVKSPLSRQQEVSGYGAGDGEGDNNDDWMVVCDGAVEKWWRRESKVYLYHVGSKKYLGGSSTVSYNHQNCGSSCPIMNHLEIFARASRDKYGEWFVESGVHIHR